MMTVRERGEARPQSLNDEIHEVMHQVDLTMHREENYYRPGVTRPTAEDWKERVRWLYAVLLKVVATSALAAPAAPPELDYVTVLHDAQAFVRASVLWKRFIDGTPLENDLAVWMTDFAFNVSKRRLAAPAAGEAQPHEICICAAVRFADARIVRGHRHDSCFRTADGWTPRPDFNGCVQGFITSWDRFVDRVKGMDLMRKTARRSAHTGLQFSGSEPGEQLFSEDLYFDSHDHAAMPADPGRRAPAPALPGFHLCDDHQPDRWESDGTCPICEGHALKQQNERQRDIIKQFSDDLVAASETITMTSLENVTLRTSLREFSDELLRWARIAGQASVEERDPVCARADARFADYCLTWAAKFDKLIGDTPQEPTQP